MHSLPVRAIEARPVFDDTYLVSGTNHVIGGKLFLASASHRPKLELRPIPAFFQVVPGRMPNTSDAATMHTANAQPFSTDSRDVCTIVIIYDDDATRARALDACDFLVKQFWQEVELEFHWWRTDFLRDATLGTVASKNAVASDFLIVCLDLHRGITPTLESWFESWLVYRSNREGALMDLTSIQKSDDKSRQTETFLREVSQRGCFEYLTAIPDKGKPSPKVNISNRVNHESVDEILGESRPPSHFGLNE